MNGLKIIAPVIGLFLLSSPAAAQGGQEPPPAPVRGALAKEMQIAPVIDLPATVISRNDSLVSTEIAGRITWIAEVGAELKEGDVVARLDDAFLKLELANAQATVKRLEARLAFENRQVERFEELAMSNSTPAQRVDEIRMNRDVSEQELASARLTAERIKLQLARTAIRAPFPARVVSRAAQIGEYAGVGSEIARLVDTEHLEIRVQAPIATNQFIKEDMRLVVKDNGEYSEFPIRAIVPVGDEISRTIEIRLSVPTDKWVIGTPLRISVPNASPRQTLAVPRDALILRRDDVYVFRIDEENKAERIGVRTGAASGSYIEVFGPINKGDNLVIRGGERLQAGRAVSVLGQSS